MFNIWYSPDSVYFQYVQGVIQSLLKSGMLVTLSDHIRGYCYSLHYADVALKHPEKKLHEGKKVKCRVRILR